MLHASIKFTDGQTIASDRDELQALYKSHGATEVSARISTAKSKPVAGDAMNLDEAVTLARLAHSLDLEFSPQFGLFHEYGGPMRADSPHFSEFGQLQLPSGWHLLGLDMMCRSVRDYGSAVASEILGTGVEVSVWYVGGDSELGCAGIRPSPTDTTDDYRAPDGVDPQIGRRTLRDVLEMDPTARIAWLGNHIWPYVGAVLSSFATGVRSVDPRARVATHMSALGAAHGPTALAFWSTMRVAGFQSDELGFALYPSNPSTNLDNFKRTVQEVTARFGQRVFISEFAYPASPMSGDHEFCDWNRTEAGYPISIDGQACILEDLARWGRANGVAGIRPWGADLCVGLWAPMAMFELSDRTALARPCIDSIARGLA